MRLPSSRSSARALEQFSAASGHALTVSCSHRGQRAEGTKARVAAKTQEARNEAALPQETNAPTPSGRSSARATFGSKRATPRGSPLDARLHWQFPAATEGTKARVAAGNQAPSTKHQAPSSDTGEQGEHVHLPDGSLPPISRSSQKSSVLLSTDFRAGRRAGAAPAAGGGSCGGCGSAAAQAPAPGAQCCGHASLGSASMGVTSDESVHLYTCSAGSS